MKQTEQIPKVVEEQLVLKKLAALCDTGLTQKQMAKECNITVHQVQRIMRTDDFKELVCKLGDDYLSESKKKWNTGVAKLLDKCLSVLRDQLDAGSLEAVKISLKSLGIGNEEQRVGETNISVILPDTKTETEIEPSYTVDDTDSV